MQIEVYKKKLGVLACYASLTVLSYGESPFKYLSNVNFPEYFNRVEAGRALILYPPGGGDRLLAQKSESDLQLQREILKLGIRNEEIQATAKDLLKNKNYWGFFYYSISFSGTNFESRAIDNFSHLLSDDSLNNFCICYSVNTMIALIPDTDKTLSNRPKEIARDVKKSYTALVAKLKDDNLPLWASKRVPKMLDYMEKNSNVYKNSKE
jgi:hypothetical protein